MNDSVRCHFLLRYNLGNKHFTDLNIPNIYPSLHNSGNYYFTKLFHFTHHHSTKFHHGTGQYLGYEHHLAADDSAEYE
jgi:hypothetical protein